MRVSLFTVLLLSLCAACGAQDGPATESAPQQTPAPSNADPDGDYLSDAKEAELGTDPNNPDSDGDSYLDGDEVLENTDPLDADSVIYQGGWPYQRLKDDIVDPGFDGQAVVGSVIPRLVSVDQFGQQVDLYDFAKHGVPVVVDLSAGWCAACLDAAAWLDGEPSNLGMMSEFDAIPEMVRSGEIYWITVVFEDASANPATAADAAAWHANAPNEHVAVLADDDRAMFDHLWPGAYPALFVVDEDMALTVYDRYDYAPALRSLLP
jgi:hypothetical protein